MQDNSHPTFINALLRPAAYPHPVDRLELHETHISWVILTGEFVYKIKKPVNFGFLDFSTLEKRCFYCNEEIRLNRRLAPDLYLATVAICGDSNTPQIAGNGPPFEYAVKMRQFDTRQGFDQLVARGELTLRHMSETAQVLAIFHSSIDVAEENSVFGTPSAVHQPVEENFQQLRASLDKQSDKFHELLNRLEQWSNNEATKRENSLASRHCHGFVRECHGDLHLRNIVVWQDKVTPFDGIEFNPNLRWIDVMSELAFLLMDLDDHQRHDLGQHLLNSYLEITGDYTGLDVLRYYLVYRAMVRAKVACLRLAQTAYQDKNAEQEIQDYLKLAQGYTRPSQAKLIINHGLSGSGKTFVSQQLLIHNNLIRLRSDVERKRLFGLSTSDKSASGLDTGIYRPEASQQTYQHLFNLAEQLLKQGYIVLVDAAFLKTEQRTLFSELARRNNIPFMILHCEANPEVQRQRLQTRSRRGHDASEADVAILEQQLKSEEPLSDTERAMSLTLDTSGTPDLDTLINWLEQSQGTSD